MPTNTPTVLSDRAALVALYNATGGPNWTDNTNWLSDKPLGEWHGVTTDDSGRVTEIDLLNNGLSGKIPPKLGSLSNLTYLRLSSTRLSGKIPPELGNLSKLVVLYLYNNQLTGEIPSELGNLSNLLRLSLEDNQLTGEIPVELGNLSSLSVARSQLEPVER